MLPGFVGVFVVLFCFFKWEVQLHSATGPSEGGSNTERIISI